MLFSILMVWIDNKGIFRVRKVQFRPLLSIWTNISETVHDVTNVCMKYIYEVIYDLSIDLVTFDLGLLLKVKSRSQTCQGAVSH